MKAIPSKVAAVNAHHIDGSVISASEHHLVESRCKAHSPFTCFFVWIFVLSVASLQLLKFCRKLPYSMALYSIHHLICI
jgi:hypothetical protein